MLSQSPLSYRHSLAQSGIENHHPDVWRASQLARDQGATVNSGFIALNRELPGGGWPLGQLIEILIAEAGIAEFKLLLPSLKHLGKRPIALLAPPHIPYACAYQGDASEPLPLLWIAGKKHSDQLWSAEQILKNGSCGALLLWQTQIKTEVLRRLHLMAQKSQTLFFVIRPLNAAQSPSPAILRIALTPKASGLQIDILKRRGAANETPLFLYINDHPYLSTRRVETVPLFAADIYHQSNSRHESSTIIQQKKINII